VGKVEKHLLLMINMRILLICKCNEPTISKGQAYQVKEELIDTKTHIDQIAFSILE
jgi:cell division protein FtsL